MRELVLSRKIVLKIQEVDLVILISNKPLNYFAFFQLST